MKKLMAIILTVVMMASLAVTASADSLAVVFDDAAGKSASGATEPVVQMQRFGEVDVYGIFVEGTALAVTFTSEGIPHINIRCKSDPFSNTDNIWLFREPSSVNGNVAYFTYEDVKQLYLNGTCQNSGKNIVDLEPDFETFLADSCDWLGVYTYNNTVTITKIEVINAEDIVVAEPEVTEPEVTEPEVTETEPEVTDPADDETAEAPETGLALAVVPAVLAMAAVVISKRR